jgi:hypothetical protein
MLATTNKCVFSVKALLLLFVGLSVLFWCFQPAYLDGAYFPADVGDAWTYESDDGDVTFMVTSKESAGEHEVLVVRRILGDQRLDFYISRDQDGVRIHRVGADFYRPAFKEFAFKSTRGAAWSWKGAIGREAAQYNSSNEGLEDVDVPLGKFRAFHVIQANEHNITHFWLAKGVGVVKVLNKGGDSHDPIPGPFEWRLREFRSARAQPNSAYGQKNCAP